MIRQFNKKKKIKNLNTRNLYINDIKNEKI